MTTMPTDIPIQRLHHMAWRCRHSGRTRAFYEDFLGLPLVGALRLGQTKTGRAVQALHTFFQLADGSCLAFFEVPDQPFEFKSQHDFDLHIALQVTADHQARVMARARTEGRELRGVADHGFIQSIYLRDPDGYVVELAVPSVDGTGAMDAHRARQVLAEWTADQAASSAAASSSSPASRP